jgi:AhpD family alkylhydroperoxidase
MATTPRIPHEFAKGFTMMSEGADTPAAKIAIPIETARLAGIPIASQDSITLDPVVHECIRLYNAHYQGCTYCANARQAVAVQAGLDEDLVSKITRFEQSDMPEHIKAALRITEALATAPQMMSDALWSGARAHYSEQEVIDIVLLSCFTTGSRVAIILGVEPGKEASSRLFYPDEDVYGSSPELKEAIRKLEDGGILVRPKHEGFDPIGTRLVA